MEHNNPSTLIFLVNDDVRAVAVTYEKIDVTKDTSKMKYQPAYLSQGKLPEGATVFKTMDPKIKVNDFVIVPTDTRHGMTVCQVVAVDIEIDFQSEKEVHWIVGTVDLTEFERLRKIEDEMIAKVKAARVSDERERLSRSLLKNLGTQVGDIPMLTKSVDAHAEEGGQAE